MTAGKLFEFGGFGLSGVEGRLLNTIRDAMQLTQRLGIRYL